MKNEIKAPLQLQTLTKQSWKFVTMKALPVMGHRAYPHYQSTSKQNDLPSFREAASDGM